MSDVDTQDSEQKKAVLQLQQRFLHICRRILEINEECSGDMGCPYAVVVMPMITQWRLRAIGRLPDPPPALDRALRGILSAASNGGRVCEIGEVKAHARAYISSVQPLDKHTSLAVNAE